MAISKTIPSDIVFGGKPERPWMRLLSFKPYRKNNLRGYADVEVGIGQQITGLTLHGDSGERWIGMPSKQVLDADGRHVAGHDGKKTVGQDPGVTGGSAMRSARPWLRSFLSITRTP